MSFLSRQARFGRIASTQDVVRGWLADGVAEVCLAVADEQAAGRGRAGRAWVAPPGAALLCSLGFRPAWLEPAATWRLGAITSLAMADAAEDEAGLALGTIRCKWPNDLVVEDAVDPARPGEPVGDAAPARKLAGLLGESADLGTPDVTAAIGIGINVDWEPADFPADLAPFMTSLRRASGGRPVDRDALLDGFVARLEARVEALRGGRFPVDDWAARQLTTGRFVRLEGHGPQPEDVVAVGVDHRSGALLVADQAAPGGERQVHAGEVTRVRVLAGEATGAAPTSAAGGPPAAAATGRPAADHPATV